MYRDEAEAILEAIKLFETSDGRENPAAEEGAIETLVESIRAIVEDAAELGGFYTDLMGASDQRGPAQPGPFSDLYTGRFRVHLVHEGERYGATGSLVYGDAVSHSYPNIGQRENDCQLYGHGLPLVEFYDISQDPVRFPGGQFITRYYMSTLLGMGGSGRDIAGCGALALDDGVPAWTVSGRDLNLVVDWLSDVRESYAERPRGTSLSEMAAGCKAVSDASPARARANTTEPPFSCPGPR